MSAEWWDDPPDQKRRSCACGHAMLAEDLPDLESGSETAVYTCPTCGDSQSGKDDLAALRLVVVRDGVPHTSASWGESRCRLRIKLGDRRRGQGSVANVEALLKRMSSPRTTSITLPPRRLTVKPGLLQHGPPDTLVLRATPAGCTVSHGEVQLPGAAVLLLSGQGAHFRGVSFFGGILVCCGGTFSASFQQCFFQGCRVYAVHGAAVTLRRCSFRHCPVATLASGTGSTLHVQACTFENSVNAVTVECGATVVAAQCHIDCPRNAFVFGPGSHVSFERCELVTTSNATATRDGVVVKDASVRVRHCFMKHRQQSIAASGRAAVEVHHSTLEASRSSATVAFENHVWALLRESDVQMNRREDDSDPPRPRAALRAEGSTGGALGPRVIAERCRLRSDAEMGVGVLVAVGMSEACRARDADADAVLEDARAVLRGCDVHSARSMGCGAGGLGCSLIIDGGRVSSAGQACGIMSGGAVVARSALLEGVRSAQSGPESVVSVGDDGSAVLSCCRVRGGCIGVQLLGGRAVVRDTEVSHLVNSDRYEKRAAASSTEEWRSGHGYAVHGGELKVVGGVVRGCLWGAGLYSMYDLKRRERIAAFDGVLFDENATAVFAGLRAKFRTTRCQFRVRQGEREAGPATQEEAESVAENDRVSAVMVQKSARGAALEDCTFVGYDEDISSSMRLPIQISGCSFQGGCVGVARVKLTTQGHGVIENCSFASALIAVSIQGDAPGSTVRGCTFDADVGIGVDVEGACRALMSACSFSCSQGSVVAETGANVSVEDCTCMSATGIAAVNAASVDVLRTSFDCTDHGVEVHTDAVTRISVRDCKLRGGQTAVWLNAGANAVLAGCSIASCKAGLRYLPASSAQLRDCVVTDCATGVAIGPANDKGACAVEETCEVCGLVGWAALTSAAWSAANGQADGGTGSARCVHDGAVSDVALTDVKLVRCGTGLQVYPAGRVAARGVVAADCGAGVNVVRVGHVSSFQGCSVVGATGPAVRAVRQLGPEEGFRLEEEEVAGVVVSSSAVEGLHTGV